jgi:hypothetical protein
MARGLCQACYAAARKKIAAGHETWEHLISLGLAKHAAQGRRGVFGEALARARREDDLAHGKAVKISTLR